MAGRESTDAPERICLQCGYLLAVESALRCSECGARFDAAESARTAASLHRTAMTIRRITLVATVFPIVHLAVGHLSWLVATIDLGRPPRPYADIWNVPAFCIMITDSLFLSCLAIPLVVYCSACGAVVGVLGLLERGNDAHRSTMALLARRSLACLITWLLFAACMSMDPLSVIAWRLDS